MKNTLWKLSIFAFSVLGVASAQTFQGTLRGRVVDPNGAVTSNARITLTDEGTQVARTTVTNNDGEYTFASLTPSTYSVTVEATGFKKLEQKGIVIVTQTANTQDAKLDIGQVTETIDVTAEAELLNTMSAKD